MPDYSDTTPERIGELRAEEARRVTQGFEIGELRAMRVGELCLLQLELAAERDRAEKLEQQLADARRDFRTACRDHETLRRRLEALEQERAAAQEETSCSSTVT